MDKKIDISKFKFDMSTEKISDERRESEDQAIRNALGTTLVASPSAPYRAPTPEEILNQVNKINEKERAHLVTFTDSLNRRLRVQGQNLLIEYRINRKDVPVEKVQELMEKYGYLIAQLIVNDQSFAWSEFMKDLDWATSEIVVADAYYSDTIKAESIRKKYGLK